MPATTRAGRREILPLYARLSMQEQQRVFEPHSRRRIVIATNVAESSLTVPGIRYVDRPRHGADQPLFGADENPAAAGRSGVAGLGRPEGGAMRAHGAGRVHSAVRRRRLSQPRPLHVPRNPAEQPGLGHTANEGVAAWRHRAVRAIGPAAGRGDPRRLQNALRVGRARLASRVDRRRPPIGPAARRPAHRTHDSRRRRGRLSFRNAR